MMLEAWRRSCSSATCRWLHSKRRCHRSSVGAGWGAHSVHALPGPHWRGTRFRPAAGVEVGKGLMPEMTCHRREQNHSPAGTGSDHRPRKGTPWAAGDGLGSSARAGALASRLGHSNGSGRRLSRLRASALPALAARAPRLAADDGAILTPRTPGMRSSMQRMSGSKYSARGQPVGANKTCRRPASDSAPAEGSWSE